MKESKPLIKIKFADFWPDFDLPNFMFYKLLIKKYEVIISDRPDLLFYSVYGNNHSRFKCTKIFFTAENIRPDFKACDFAFSFDYILNKRNYRLPLYAFYDDVTKLLNRKINAIEILNNKKKFCCFVVSNPACSIRNNFFSDFSKQKHIDSGGKLFNNMDKLIENKREFIKDYKFVIAFENSSYPGYVTEKVFEPLLEDCIPIYWGNPLIHRDFNTRRFINCHDFASFQEVMKFVLEIDNDDKKYMQYINEPAFTNNELNEFVKEDKISCRLEQIIEYNNTRSCFLKKYQKIRPLYCFLIDQQSKLKKIVSLINRTLNANT